MKQFMTFFAAAFAATVLALASPMAHAGFGHGPGDGSGPVLNIFDGTQATISGIVAGINGYGRGIQVDTGDEIVSVYGLGPAWFWDASGAARPEIGEEIAVDAYEVTFSDNTTRAIAASITVGGQNIALRDAGTGAPLWRGMGGLHKYGAMGSGNFQQGRGLRDGSCLNR